MSSYLIFQGQDVSKNIPGLSRSNHLKKIPGLSSTFQKRPENDTIFHDFPDCENPVRNVLDHFQPNQMTQIGLGVQKVCFCNLCQSQKGAKKNFEKFSCFFLLR